MLQRSDPKSHLALLERWKLSRTISKRPFSPLPLLDFSKIYDLLSEVGQAWRRSWIIYQGTSLPRSLEQMPHGLNFTDFFPLPSSSNLCLGWTQKVFFFANCTMRPYANKGERSMAGNRFFLKEGFYPPTHCLHIRYLDQCSPLALPLFLRS